MITKILGLKVPFPVVVVLMLLLALVGAFGFVRFRTVMYDYHVTLSSENASPESLEFGAWPAMENKEFFQEVRETMVKGENDFVEADLSSMQLTVYEKGVPSLTVPILTKGKPGSWWETPAGLYKAEDKIRDHFSGFAEVHLPWSIPFQGNFFLHGWPYYANGAPVASTYSGGCIRLSTEDARKVFDLVQVGIPIIVFEEDFARDEFRYYPTVRGAGADAYLAADLKNDFVFTEKNSATTLPTDSIAKLMTAIVAVEYVNIERFITVAESAAMATTSIPRMKTGERYMLYDLLHPLLLESSNEAAKAIAGFMGTKRFVALMNQKAKAIGMKNAVFFDPAGEEGGNTVTPEDVFVLAKYLYHNRKFILNISAGETDVRTYGYPAFRGLKNLNSFGDDAAFVGGTVSSGNGSSTALAIFEIEIGGAKRPVAVIVRSEHNKDALANLLQWARNSY